MGLTLVKPTTTVKDLGVYFDAFATMSDQVSKICQAASFALYRIGRIRRLLDRRTTEKLIHAFITSRLDYCNSVLYGIDAQHIARLQGIQNSAARIVTRTRKYDHITPVLIDLHWLPIPARIEFKIALIVFKIMHNSAPSYLSSLVSRHAPPAPVHVALRTRQSTRHMQEVRLEPVDYTQKNFGARSFSYSAPLVWNALPLYICTAPSMVVFKARLKTFFLQKYLIEPM